MVAPIRLRARFGALLAAALGAACASGGGTPDVTHDGLERVADARVDRAWIKPDADFGAYSNVALLDCGVSFRRNWKTNHPGVRSRDIERIKQWLSDEFRSVFSEALESGGVPVVGEPGERTLLIRPAIIDLDIAAPDRSSPSRSRSFTTWPGSMTLVLELYDATSNEILARAIDSRRARNAGGIQWTTSGTNREAARRILRSWADLLVRRLDEVRGGSDG